MDAYIPILKGDHPEFNMERQQVEPHTLDYTHLLTNLHCQICRKGIENIPRSAFVCVCEEHPESISRALVIDIIDKQSSEFALKLFSPSVEEQLLKMVKRRLHYLCIWFTIGTELAMNVECQLMKVNNLWAFYCYLVKDVSLDRFPAPGMYIKEFP